MSRQESDSAFDIKDQNKCTEFKGLPGQQDMPQCDSIQDQQILLSPHLQARMEETKEREILRRDERGTGGAIECNEESASSSSSFFKLPKSLMKKNKNFFELDPSIPSENEEDNCYSNENSHNNDQQDSSQKQQQQEMDEIADLVEEESNKNKIPFTGSMQGSMNNIGHPPAINYSLFRLQPSASLASQAQQISLHMNLSQVNEPNNVLSIEQLVLSPSQILITNNRDNENSSQKLLQKTFTSSQDSHCQKLEGNIFFQDTTNEARVKFQSGLKNQAHHNFASVVADSDSIKTTSQSQISQIHPQTQILDHLADLALHQEVGKPFEHHSGFSIMSQQLPYSSSQPKSQEETKSENAHLKQKGAMIVVPPPPIQQENNLNEALLKSKNQTEYYLNENIDEDGGSPNRDQDHQLHQFSSPSSQDDEGSEGSSNSSSSIDQESPRLINNNDEDDHHEGLILMDSVNNHDENMLHNHKEEEQGNKYHQLSAQVLKDTTTTLKKREDNSFQQVNQSQDEGFALRESTIQEMMRALEEPTNAQIKTGKQQTDALDPLNNQWQQRDYQIYNQPPSYGHNQQSLNNASHAIYQNLNQRQLEQERFGINSLTQYNQGQIYDQVSNNKQSILSSQNHGSSHQNMQPQIPHHEFQIPDVPSLLSSSMKKKGGAGITTNQTRRSQIAQDPKMQSQQDQRMLSQSSKDSDSYSRQPQHSNFDDMQQQQRLLISGFEGIDLTNQHRQQARKPSNEPMRNPSCTSIDFKQINEKGANVKKEQDLNENLMEFSSSHQSASYQAYKESIQRRVTPMAGQLGGILINQNHQVFASGSKNNNNNLNPNNLSAQNINLKTGGILSQVSGASTGTTTSTINLIDQNETVLQKVISAYEEAQTQAQKLEALRGGAVVELALNQAGSKFLQKVLENANPQIVQYLLNEISPMLPEIMVDNYGNYFCQKLLTNCSADQRMQILERISEEFVSICCDKRGTHTVQTFIDLVNLEKEIKYFQRVLHGHVAELSLEVQGTHVIQILIKCFDEQARQFVFDEIYDRLIELSMNNHGLCVVKLIIAKTTIPENQVRMMQKLVDNAIELAQNPYGNYAIQQAFDFWDEQICQEVIPKFFGKIYQLSMQKCSSNVIDKSIQKAKPEYLSKILQELIKCDRLNNLIMNQYGNFVVQNALKFANQEEKLLLSEQIEKVIPGLPDAKIKGKWIQLLKKASQNHYNFPSGNKSNAIMSTSSRGNQSQRSDNSEERSETSSFHHKKSIFSQNSSQTTKTSQCSYFDARNFKQHQSIMMPPPPKRVQSGIYIPHNQFGQNYQSMGQSTHEISYPNYQHLNIQGQPPIQQMGPNYPQNSIPFNYGSSSQYPRPNNGGMGPQQQYNQQVLGGHPNQPPFQKSQYHGQVGVGQHFQPPPGLHPPIQQGIYPQAQNFGGPNQHPHYLQQNGQHPFFNHGAASSHHQGFTHPHQMQFMMNPQSSGMPPHSIMGGGMQGNIPPGQGFPTQVQNAYDPLTLGGNNYFGSQGATNQSSLKRHASDNIQFYASRGLAYHNQNQVTSNMQQQQQTYPQNQGNPQLSRQ